MTYIVLDIETIAHPDASQWLEPPDPDGRLTDPVKIEADIAKKTLERNEKLALDPDTNRIVALGYYVIGQNGDPFCYLMKDEFEEREQLTTFAKLYTALNKRGEVRLVTFYGLFFDLITLVRRAMYLDVPAFPKIKLDKYRSEHADFDVWWRLSERGLTKAHSLKFYGKRMGFGTLDKVNGADIAQLVRDEQWSAVEAHCLSDVGLTHALANRIGLLT